MRDELVRLWLDLRHGHRTVNDEGNFKDRYRPSEMPDHYESLGVSERESRAGQYMRRLRRLERREK